MASSRSVSYASGESTAKLEPYRKSMLTFRIWSPCPGTLAPKRRRMPSSGWTRMASTFGSICGTPARAKSASGACLNCTAISVTRLGNALPVRR